MRHFVANIATYAIAVLLLAGAGVFAWVRSAQVAITSERAVLARYQPEPGAVFRWEELGASSYRRNCTNCHMAEGEGWDQYPELGRARDLLRAPGGRDYLIDLHLYGADSPRWRAPMPPMGHMHDVEIAAVINYVVRTFGDGPPADSLLSPAEVAARRGISLSPAAVERGRPALD